MKNVLRNNLRTLAAGACALAVASFVHAVPTLSVRVDGGAPVIIPDGSAAPLDGGAGAGQVSWTGAIGTWTFIVTSGTTKPANGSATAAELHVNIIGNSTSAVPTTLSVMFSEVDFGPINSTAFRVDSSATIDASMGSLGNTVTHNAYFDAPNTLFGTGTLLGTSTFLTGANSLNQISGPQTDTAYALTGAINLTHVAGTGRSSSASLDIVQAVPEGGFTLSLLGLGVLALAGLRRKLA